MCSRERSCSPASARRSPAAAPTVAAAALLLPALYPSAAAAAAAAELPRLAADSPYLACLGLGTAGVITTLLLTSRFLLSYFPSLEKAAKQRPSKAVMLRLLTVADPVLDPISKGFFKQASVAV